MAVQQAAREIKARLSRYASETWNVAEDLISFRDDRVFVGNESVPFGELTKKAYASRVHLAAAGFYKTPKLYWDRDKGKGRPFFYFAYGAACCEVALGQSGRRYRPDRRRVRARHGLADHRRAGLRR